MRQGSRMFAAGFVAALALIGLAGAGIFALDRPPANASAASFAPIRVASVDYGPQKVVYHAASRGSWRDRESEAWRLVSVLNNHLNAVEPDPVEMQVILQGDGIETLKRARTNPALGAAVDNLKKRGVRFRVCANTLEAYHLGLSTLHKVSEEDLVQAGVAELIRLQQQGFAYIKF